MLCRAGSGLSGRPSAATDQQILNQVKEAILVRVKSGEQMAKLPEQIDSILQVAGVSPQNPQYSEMVMRTNMLDAYTTGTIQATQDPAVNEMFPAWRYSGIRDGRQRHSHQAQFDKVFSNKVSFAEVRDKIDKKFSGYNCRCCPVPVSKYALRRGNFVVLQSA